MTIEGGRDFKEVDHHDHQMSSDFYDYEIVVLTYETGARYLYDINFDGDLCLHFD